MRLSARTRRDLMAVGVVAVVITIQWCAAVGIFMGQRLGDPIQYTSDSYFTAAAVTAGMRGDLMPFVSKMVPSLGAPFAASWNDFPGTDDWLFFVVGHMARVLGVFGATNVSFLLTCIFAGWSLFFVARRFHFSRPFATMSAILFGLSGYAISRGTTHFSLIIYWVLPLHILTAAWLMSRKGIPFRSKKFAITLAVGVITGWSFVYYAFFAMQLYALALLVRLFKPKRKQPLIVALALASVTLVSMLSMNLDTLMYASKNGPNQAAVFRAPTDVEQYALKPISMLVPGATHRWEFFRTLSARAATQALVQGEIPNPYLGVLQNVMALGLALAAIMAVARGRMNVTVMWALMVGYLVIAHGVGGENSIMGLAGFRLFRSVNRVSILVLAYILIFAAWAMPRLLRRFGPKIRWAVALLIALFGTYEPIPLNVTPETIARNHQLAESDRTLVAQAEAALPEGAAVFELPVMDFPEVPNYANLETYELFRPYFFAQKLRFSHGDVKGRPNSQWKFRAAALPPPQFLTELRNNGFAAIYVNFKAFPGQEQRISDSLIAAGARVLAKASAGDSMFFAL